MMTPFHTTTGSENHKPINNAHCCVALPYIIVVCLSEWHRSGRWLLLAALRHSLHSLTSYVPSGMTSAFDSYLSCVCICIALQAVAKQSRVVRMDQVALHTKGGQQAAVRGLVRQGLFSLVTVGSQLPSVMHHDNCTVILNGTSA